jgi:hypothetical protein
MRNFGLIIISFLMLFSCNKKPETAIQIIDKSIEFHDPENEWENLFATFSFNSSFSFNDSIPEELNITIDNLYNDFTYRNADRKVEIQYTEDSCKLISDNGSCEGYAWTKNFYTYVWGLPMKLKDPNIKPIPEWNLDTINNYPCYAVYVNYEAENFTYYIDQVDFQLRAFQFLKNDNSGKGEIIHLEGLIEYKDFQFPKKRIWLHLNGDTIGTNEAMYINEIWFQF